MSLPPEPQRAGLREALIATVPVLLAEGGIEAVTTRACARRQGVASSAVFRHFRDKRALMSAYAAICYSELAAAIGAAVAAAGSDPVARFRAMANAYLGYALANEDRFRVMFRGEIVDFGDEELLAAAEALDAAAGTVASEIGSRLSDTATLGRATVHGLACLAIDSPLRHTLPEGAERQAALMTMLRRLLPVLRA